MNYNPRKELSKNITKEELEYLYNDHKMTLDNIGKYFGFIDRQPIIRLFKKFNIKSRTKSENAKLIYNSEYTPEKETLEKIIKDNSISSAARSMNVSRELMTKWLDYYNIKPKYFKYKSIKDKINDIKYNNYSIKELSVEFNVPISVITYYRLSNDTNKIYSIEEIKNKIKLYDLNNQGIVKCIKLSDKNLYDSILYHTKDHILQSKKFTERIFRIINDYDRNFIDECVYCHGALKFYTIDVGYGLSDIKICKNCVYKHNGFGVSKISQELFYIIYIKMKLKNDECFFDYINHEYRLKISKNDKDEFKNRNINENCYNLDFVYRNKIIEFDGDYWHKDDEKEQAKSDFLKYKGYEVLHIKEHLYYKDKQKVIEECIQFLQQ